MGTLIDRASLEAIRCASKDKTRTNLNGVCIMPDGEAIALDGHHLVSVSPVPASPEEHPGDDGKALEAPVVLSRADAKAISKATTSKSPLRALQAACIAGEETNRNGHVAIRTGQYGDVELKPEKVPVDFPETRHLWPEPGQGFEFAIRLNPDFIQDIAAAAKVAGRTNLQGLTMIFRGKDADSASMNPVILHWSDGCRTVKGLVAPMLLDDKPEL